MTSSQDTYVTTNYGSSLTAGGDINIVGSHISGENVTLITNNESTVDARDTLTIISGGDTNIIGSQVYGDTVEMSVGEDLNIVSLNYKDKQKNWSASASTTGAVSGSFSNQNINSEYASVQEQAGIFAGEGGYNIEVGGNTHLGGAVIASEADPENNRLSTDTLTWSDIENRAEWESETNGVGFATGPGTAAKDKGLTPIFAGSDGEDSSMTYAAISPGEIEIRNEEDQKQDVDDLSRDAENANNPLDKIFDKEEILERERAAALFGEMAFEAAGKLIKEFGWDPGDPRRAILHGLIGGIMADINGGKFGDGLTTAMINKILIDQLVKSGLVDGAELRWISGLLGVALDGGQGGLIADSATRNNALFLPLAAPIIIDGVVFAKVVITAGIVTFIAENGDEISMSINEAIKNGYIDANTFENLDYGSFKVKDEFGTDRYFAEDGSLIGNLTDYIVWAKKEKDYRDSAKEAGIPKDLMYKYKEWFHKRKGGQGRGPGDNYTYPELIAMAKEFMRQYGE